jgi:hypothetical protein
VTVGSVRIRESRTGLKSKMWTAASRREKTMIALAAALIAWQLALTLLAVAGLIDRDLRRWLWLPGYFVLPTLALISIKVHPHHARGLITGALGFSLLGISNLLGLTGVSGPSDLWALPSVIAAIMVNVAMVMMAWDQWGVSVMRGRSFRE